MQLPFFFATRVFSAPKDSNEVTKAVAGFAEAWNRQDMQAFGQLFTTNADFVNVAGELDMGRAAIVIIMLILMALSVKTLNRRLRTDYGVSLATAR